MGTPILDNLDLELIGREADLSPPCIMRRTSKNSRMALANSVFSSKRTIRHR
jgi:hypothetical protein